MRRDVFGRSDSAVSSTSVALLTQSQDTHFDITPIASLVSVVHALRESNADVGSKNTRIVHVRPLCILP